MRRTRLAVALLVALVVAGCLGERGDHAGEQAPSPTSAATPPSSTPAPVPVPPSPRSPSTGFRVVALPTPCGTCFEPSVTLDGAGRIVVSQGYVGQLTVSEDGGRTFEARPLPLAEGPYGFSGDNLVQTGSDGRLYFSRLIGVAASGGLFVTKGVQVAVSSDAGRSWDTNVVVDLADGPPGHEPMTAADRQWLGFGADGAVYLSVNHLAPAVQLSQDIGPWGIWVSRSEDGGATFGPFTLVAAHSDRAAVGQAGPLVGASDGSLYLPLTDRADAGGSNGLAIARSTDGATSFHPLPVAAGVPVGGMASWIPVAAVSATRLAVAWVSGEGALVASSSTDSGTTWTAPLAFSGKGVVGPWLATDGLEFTLTWHEGTDATYDLRLARIPEDGWEDASQVETWRLAEGADGQHGNTDFSHLAYGPEGTAVVVWSDNAAGQIFLGIEEPTMD